MAERVDVCIVGSGFGGAISAWRLAELYRAADVDPKNILVLERGPRFKHTDFEQSMYIGHLSNVYSLIQSTQGTGAQIVVANGVGGGSNLYLAASIRSPRETFERRDHHPDDGPERRMWPKQISREDARPVLPQGRARPARRAAALGPGVEVGRPVGGHAERRGPHVRPRAVRDRPGPVPERQVVPHGLHLRGEEHREHELPGRGRARRRAGPARARGAERPALDGGRLPLHRRRRRCSTGRARTRAASRPARREEIECKVLILAAGAMGNAPILMRSRRDLPSLSGAARPPPRHQRRPRRRGRVRPEEGPRRARPARATASSTRAGRSRR